MINQIQSLLRKATIVALFRQQVSKISNFRIFSDNNLIYRHCPTCNSHHHKLVFSTREKEISPSVISATLLPEYIRKSLPLIYNYCLRCQCLFISPLPNYKFIDISQSSSKVKKRMIRDFLVNLRSNRWMEDKNYIKEKINIIKYHFDRCHFENLPKTANILDFGCGTGVTLSYFYKNGWKNNLFGIEPDYYSYYHVRRYRKYINIIWGDTYSKKLNKYHNFFDLIMFDNVFEHTTRPQQVLKTCFSLLKPGGFLWMSVPNSWGNSISSKGINYHNLNWGHWTIFSPKSLAMLCDNYFKEITLYDRDNTIKIQTSSFNLDKEILKDDWIQLIAKKS